MSKIDRDLMLGYVKELYETLLVLHPAEANAHQPVNIPPPPTPAPNIPMNGNGNGNGNGHHYENNNGHTAQNGNGNGHHAEPKENFVPNGYSLNSSYAERSHQKTLSETIHEKNGGHVSINEKLKRSGLELADKLKLTPIRDLKTFIGLNKRFAFTANLFNSNSIDYENAIDRINTSNNYDEAMAFVQSNLMPKYNWNLEDENFVDLHTFIVRRFL